VSCSAPVSSPAPDPCEWVPGLGWRKPIAKRRPEGDLDAVPASWTIEAEQDGPAQHQRCLNEPD
jgi:hypothetical protein